MPWPFGKKKPPAAAPPAGDEALDLAGDEEARYRPIDWPLIKRLFSLLAPFKRRYALGISLGVVMTFLDMLGPRFIAHIIDYTGSFASDPGGRTSGQAVWHIVQVVLLWAAIAAVAIGLQRWTILIMTNAGERVQFDLRRRIFAQLQRLSMSYYDKTRLGRIISRCTSDISSLREINVWGIDQFVKYSLMIAIAAAMLLYTEPKLFLAVAWLGPVLYVLNFYYRKKISLAYQVAREGFTRVSSNLAENITGVRVVTAFNRQSPNLGTFNYLQELNTENNVAAARITGIYQPILEFIRFIGRCVIIVYGGYLVARGSSTLAGRSVEVGSVVAAFLYWDWFMNPIIAMGNTHNQLMMAMAGAERIFDLLDMTPDVQDEAGAATLGPVDGEVAFENVTFGYRPETPVLHDVSFEAHPGQMVALVGHTGSGKSSIISLIARFYQPQRGRILVDGHDIRQVTGESLHRQMGLVLQVNYLFSGTVMENIRYAKADATDEEVFAAARAIGSFGAIMQLKDGFTSEVGERGASMSLGQRQLICFTRAFLADPRIFMLDEATSAVDTETELAVQRSLEKLLEGRTTFIVAHRLSTIMKADVILVIDQGRIVERGTHSELVAMGGKYADLYHQFASGGE